MKKNINKILTMSLVVMSLSSTSALASTFDSTIEGKTQENVQNLNNDTCRPISEKEMAEKVQKIDEILKYMDESDKNMGAVTSRARGFTFGDFFDGVSWIERDGVVSLSIDPNGTTWSWNPVAPFKANEAFNMIRDRYSNDPRWKNEESLRNQFVCHVVGAFYKSNWNLEPHRPVVSTFEMTRSLCNPN